MEKFDKKKHTSLLYLLISPSTMLSSKNSNTYSQKFPRFPTITKLPN